MRSDETKNLQLQAEAKNYCDLYFEDVLEILVKRPGVQWFRIAVAHYYSKDNSSQVAYDLVEVVGEHRDDFPLFRSLQDVLIILGIDEYLFDGMSVKISRWSEPVRDQRSEEDE